MSFVIEKLNTNCVYCNALLGDKKCFKRERNIINAVIILGIKRKNPLLSMYMKEKR